MIKDIIAQLKRREDLTKDVMVKVTEEIMTGKVSNEDIEAFLKKKGSNQIRTLMTLI